MNRIFVILGFIMSLSMYGQDVKYNTPGAGNPIIPGYFADPTVRKFGDTYYIYATTDGNGGGLGPSQVWTSKDFVNWFIQPMNWPATHYIWAPDVMKGTDNRYYMYYCQPCEIYCGVSDSPVGPWKNILEGDEDVLVPDRYVKMSITLDGQTFVDDDGSTYLYWGTWGIYPNHGCGVGKFNSDMKTFSDTTLIPNTQAIDFFEAPFVFKRNGIYYFTYSSGSCHDETYRVQYATSKVGPMGPFDFADNNPILETSPDKTIHGPGHHSILQEGDDYYIVYHRHDIPNSTRGMHRQLAVDKLTFDKDGRIEKIRAGHGGVGYLQKNSNPYNNLAFGKKVRSSSYYNDMFKAEYAVDDNNATLWRPKTCGEEWIEIDLGSVTDVRRIWTQFEYATSFYQYLIETSTDGKTWRVFADRRQNTRAGSPMMDAGKAKARYVRLTVTGNERNGLAGAIWNIKIFDGGQDPVIPSGNFTGQALRAAPQREGLIFDVNADDYKLTGTVGRIDNRKDKSQFFSAIGKDIPVRLKDGKSTFIFNGTHEFRSNFALPQTFMGNSPYTLMAWIYIDKLSDNECIVDLINAGGELEKVSLGYGKDLRTGIIAHNGSYEDMGIDNAAATSKWQHLAVTFDGYMEKIYIDGKLVKEKDIVLRLPHSDYITIGRRAGSDWFFKNSLHSLVAYDTALDAGVIKKEYGQFIPDSPYLAKAKDMSDVENVGTSLRVKAVSPYMIMVSADIASNDFALEFMFDNLTTGRSSGWTKDVEFADTNLIPGQKYKYKAKVRDTFGNIKELNETEIDLRPELFQSFSDDFSQSHDFVKDGTKGSIWSGLSGFETRHTQVGSIGGCLTISSANRNFSAWGRDNGPLLYRSVKGDFIAEVNIADFSGMTDKKSISFNEGGLMIVIDDNTNRQELLHLGIFPHYNVGNLLTVVGKGMRTQYQNNKGWNMDQHLQVERSGNKFYFRTSSDAVLWTDMPNSPLSFDIPEGKELKVGLYQVTYTDNKAYVAFDNFKMWIPE